MILELIAFPKSNKAGRKRGQELVSRTLLKAVTWRILGTFDTIFISFFITGQWQLAFSIGLVEWISKMILYILHERIWNQISWGKS